ncbi:hypothetical protein EDB84DRAFT_1434714 [Lactarius hengduanensis]|nr:hypothetical protein EDB84DRAFT_1434714 [Lactarius hengduanensis]
MASPNQNLPVAKRLTCVGKGGSVETSETGCPRSNPTERRCCETEVGALVNATWERSGVRVLKPSWKTVLREGTVGEAVDRDGVVDAESDIDTVPVGDGGSADTEAGIDTVGVREGEGGDE